MPSLLYDAKCTITNSGDFSYYHGGTIYNAYATTVTLAFPSDKYSNAFKNIKTDEKVTILSYSKELMPKNSGLEVTDVVLTVSLEKSNTPLEAPRPNPLVKFTVYDTTDTLLQAQLRRN